MRKRRVSQLGRLSVAAFLCMAVVVGVLPQTALAAPQPLTTIEPDTIRVLPGEPLTFDVVFENNASPGVGNVGYSPAIEVVLPEGADFDSAESAIFGALSPVETIEVPSSGEVTNPLTGETISGLTPGSTYLLFRLPVGSFTPEQVADTLTINAATSASLFPDEQPLGTQITATGIFIHGDSPRGNTAERQATPASADVIPVLYIPYKDAETRFGEEETATGPNFPITYTLGADIGTSTTITDLTFSEELPDNLQFTGITEINLAAGGDPTVTVTYTPEVGDPISYTGPLSGLALPFNGPAVDTNSPGGSLTVAFSSVSGTASENDVEIVFDAFVPEFDVDGQRVIDATSGGDVDVTNTLKTSATQGRGSFGTIDNLPDKETDPVVIAARNIAIQKSVEIEEDLNVEGLSAGDVVRFTLEAQISDYFRHDQIAIQDILGDGYAYNPGTGELTFLSNNEDPPVETAVPFIDQNADPAENIAVVGYPASFGDGYVHVTQNAQPGENAGDSLGFTTLNFDVSGLVAGGAPIGLLTGGAFDGDTSGATGYAGFEDDDTRFTIAFEATVLRDYQNPASWGDEADRSIDSFDTLENDVLVSGRIRDVNNEGQFDTDTSASIQEVAEPEFEKALVAVTRDGDAVDMDNGPVEVFPGDVLTFELRVDIPTGFLEELSVTDFLPLPVLDATEVENFTGPCGALPGAGDACYAAGTTTPPLGINPTISTDADENSVTFNWPPNTTFEPDEPQLLTAIVHFSVTVNHDPFHDDLHLTNVAAANFGNSLAEARAGTGTASFILREPVLDITKSVTPEVADAGDTVTYEITVVNTGGFPAHDVGISDATLATLPLTACAFVSVLDDDDATWAGWSGDLFSEAGLNVPGPVAPEEQIIVTVTCTVTEDAEAGESVENTASITQYFNQDSSNPERTTFVDPENPPSDSATFTVSEPSISKSFTDTSEDFTEDPDVAIGEIITYEVVITVPEGTSTDVTFRDTLDRGLAFVEGSFSAVSSNETDMPIDPGTPSFTNPTPAQPDRLDGRIEVEFGTIVNSNTDNDTNETITITYDVVVLNNSTNNNGATINNNAVWEWDEGSVSDSADNVTVREAAFNVAKTANVDEADAGDVVTYTIVVTNTGTTTAHDVVFTDVVPSGLTYVDTSFTHTDGLEPDSISALDPSGTGLTADWETFPVDESSTFEFQATVDQGLTTGTVLTNEAEVIWSSLLGDVESITTPSGNAFACERSDPDDETTCEGGSDYNDYRSTGSHDLTIFAPAFVGKDLVETSERAAGDSDPGDANIDSNPPVQIGEELTYVISFEFPEAVTPDAILADVLNPAAADGSLVLLGATLERNSANLTLENNHGGINDEPIDTPVDVTMVDGTNEFTLDLGAVTNTASSPEPETLTLTLRYRVANIVENSAGAVLTDHGELRYTGGTIATETVSVHVAEPVVDVQKVASPSSVTGGSLVTFTITIRNSAPAGGANSATGFDWTVSDALPAIYTTPSVTGTDAGSTGADVNAQFTGNTLNVTVDELNPGESVTVTYQATVSQDVQFGQEIVNNVLAQATSLRGPSDNERTGTGGVNDLADTANQTTRAGVPTIAKAITPLDNPYAIGETATFEIRAGAPVGTANNFVVTDVLDEGLVFDPGTLSVVLPSDSSSATNEPVETNAAFFTYDEASNTLTFNFGTLSIAEPGDVIITYGAYVENIIENQTGTSLDNIADLSYDDPNNPNESITAGPTTPSEEVVVGEPDIVLGKAVVSGATGSGAGDTVTWEVTITNEGNTTAYQLNWQDVMPHGPASPGTNDGIYNISNPQIDISGGDVFLNGTTTPPTAGDVTISTSTNPNDTITLDPIQVAAGATITITFDTVVGDGVLPNQELTNETEVTYESLPDDPERSRDGSGDPDDPNDPNDYRDRTSSEVVIDATVAIDKTVSPTRYTIGQLVEYEVVVSVIQGITASLVVTDELPAGLVYVDHSIIMGTLGNPNTVMQPGNPDYDTRLGTGQIVQFDFGDLSNPDDGNASNDALTILITARVENVAGNQNGVVLGNHAHLTFVDANDVEQTVDFDADPVTPEIDPREITIIEPELEITKTVQPTDQALDNLVTFTIRVEHLDTSTSTAHDVLIVDTLPTGLTYEDGSAVIPNGGTVTPNGQELTFEFSSITLDNNAVEFTYQARIDPTAVVDQPLTNGAYLTWTSLPDATGDQDSGRTGDDGPGGPLNDYADEDSATVIPTTAAFITIDKSVADITDDSTLTRPGDILEYTVVVENTNGPVTGVVVTDAIPVSSTYVEGSLTVTSGNGTPDDSGDPLVVNIGDMAEGDVTVFTFQVRVDDFTPAGTIIENTATVVSNQTVPTSSEANRPVNVPAEASLRAEKRVELSNDLVAPDGTINVGDEVTYTITITNTGDIELTLLGFEDSMPEGVDVISATGADWSCTVTDGVNDAIDCDFIPVQLGPGSVTTISIVAEVTAAGTWVNEGTVTSNETDPTPTDGNDDPNDGEQPTEFTSVPEGETGTPAIDITKSVTLVREHNADGLLNPDEDIRYTITIVNNGSAPATDVRLTDEIPELTALIAPGVTTSTGFVVNPATQPPPPIPAPYEVVVNIGTIPAGSIATVTIDLNVSADHPVPGVVSNQAFVDFEENPGDPVPSDDPSTTDPDDPTTIPITEPWIFDPPSGFKTVDPTGYPTLVWEMVWINPSNTIATNARVTDPIPEDTTYIEGSVVCEALGSSTTVVCEYDEENNQIVWEGSIAPDPGATGADDAANEVIITFETTISPDVTEVSNQACAYWDSDGDGFIGGPDGDPDELNQQPVCTDDPTTTEPGDPTFWRAPDLSIDKATSGPFAVGQQGTYVLAVTNAGAGASFNEVVVTDVLPAGLDFVSAAGEGWTCEYDTATRTITCLTDAIVAPGESLPDIVVTVDVTQAALPTVVNAAVVGTDGDINPENDRDEIVTEIIPPDEDDDGSAIWDRESEPGLLCTESCTSGSIFFPWVANDDDFGLGPADTSISIQNLENRDSYIFIYRGIGDGKLAGEDAWELATVAYLARHASKTFTPAQLGLEPGEGAPIGVAAYNKAFVSEGGDLVIEQVSIGGYAKQAAGGDNLPLTTAEDDVVDGYNAFTCHEIGMFDDWYLPIVQTNVGPGGAWNSIIRVANYGVYHGDGQFNGTGSAAVTLRFFPSDDGSGSLNTGFQLQHTVNAGSTIHIDLSEYVPEGWVGSVHIYSDGAISAMTDRYKAGDYMLWLTTTASNPGHELEYTENQGEAQHGRYVLFAPDVRMDHFGWNTGINVANLVEADNNVTIQYFNMLGNAPNTMTRRLAPHGMTYFYDPSQAGQNVSDQDPASDVNANAVGSALIWSDHPIAVAVDATKYPESDPNAQVGRIQGTTYNATANIYDWQAVPLVQKGNPSTGMGATSGINIMNPNNVTTQATVHWFDHSGFQADNFGTATVSIPAFANGFVYTMTQHNLPNGFYGSAVITSTYPVVATSAQVDYQVGHDGGVIWNAFNPGGFYRSSGCHYFGPAFDQPVGGSVEVTVQDDAGDVVAGVEVTLYNDTAYEQIVRGNETSLGIPWTATGISSANGVITWTNVPEDIYWIEVTSVPLNGEGEPQYSGIGTVEGPFQLNTGGDLVIDLELARRLL